MKLPHPGFRWRGLASTSLVLIGVLCASAHAAPPLQSNSLYGVEAQFALDSTQEVVDPAALGQPLGITASVSGRFGPDGIADVAFIANGQLRVTMNPGEWDLSFELGEGIRDVVAHRDAMEGRDGLLSIGEQGVFLWRWSEAEPRGFRSQKLPGPWVDPRMLAAEPQRTAGAPLFTWVSVWDAGRGSVDSFVVMALGEPDSAPTVYAAGFPIPSAAAPLALGLLEYSDLICVALATPQGLQIYDLLGQPQLEVAFLQTTAFLSGFDHDPSSGLPRRLAWVRQPTASASFKLVAVGDAGAGLPWNLGATPVTGVSAGSAATSSDIFLNLADGTLVLLGSTCSDLSIGSDCALHFPAVVPAPWTWQAKAVTGDFEIDGFPDVLYFDDVNGAALLYARVPAEPVPAAAWPGLGGIRVDGWTSSQTAVPPAATLTLQLDPIKLAQRLLDLPEVTSLDVQVIVYAWNTYDYDDYRQNELETLPAAEGWHSGWTLGEDAPAFTLPLALLEVPELLAVELRVFDDQGAPVDIAAFSITRSCPIFGDLLEEFGLDGSEYWWPDCPPVSPPPPDPSVGIALGPGVLPLPALPPFATNEPPRIILPPH